MRGRYLHSRGFTLLEAVVVMVVTGILGAIVAVFIRQPVDAYFDVVLRAALTDEADTALRRITRDLRLAVPNSVRVTSVGTTQYLELLLTRTGGRYELNAASEACFITSCGSLTSFGSVIAANNELVGDTLVVYNQYNNASGDCSVDNPSAYCGHNVSTLTATTEAGSRDTLTFGAMRIRPLNAFETRRFQVMSGPVTYECNPATGQLRRYSGYAMTQTQPTPPSGGSSSLLAGNVSGCAFTYNAAVFQRWGIVGLQLAITDARDGGATETINIYHEAHVSNAP